MAKESKNFIEEIIERDLESGVHETIQTRFPPEPNGYLHLGHASSICLNFGLAEQYGGKCNLRFDDTNPSTEETEYVDSILNDVRWLGFEPDKVLYSSDYFDQLYDWAVQLIKQRLAYVDFSSAEEIAAMKGTPTEPGVNSPYRDTTPEENLALFEKMRAGEFPDGHCTLRAKGFMTANNMHMRDPLMYRIKHQNHHRTGDKWCIYPMYDWAHGQSDAIEKVTHSICTLEFVPHRELYNYFIKNLEIFPSKQYEFARVNISYTIMSKRKLLKLVHDGHVTGWDDPRMPTISGVRRRGYTPASLRMFAEKSGIAKRDKVNDVSLLEACVREDLNKSALRRFAILDPLKVTISNWPVDKVDWLEVENNPEDESAGTRKVAFSKEIYIERGDFMEHPPKKYFRLSPGGVLRLKAGYIIQCDDVKKDADGNVTELICSHFPDSRSGSDTSGVKVRGVAQYLSATNAVPAEVRLYDRLFKVENPAAEDDFLEAVNPDSLQVIDNALVEPALLDVTANDRFQFMRLGYFCVDRDSTPEKPVFNRTVTLRDAWAKKKR